VFRRIGCAEAVADEGYGRQSGSERSTMGSRIDTERQTADHGFAAAACEFVGKVDGFLRRRAAADDCQSSPG